MPLTEHLVELRRRLIVSLLILAAGSAAVFHFSGEFLNWLARPVGSLIFVAPTEAFYTRLRLAVYGGFLLTLPLILHQVWLFTARAIEPRWRKMFLSMLPLSYGLFLLGSALCLYLVVPTAMKFLLSYGSEGVEPMITLGAYLDFVTGLSLSFGFVFQLPLVFYSLNRMGILQRSRLVKLRRHIYLLCFLSSAFLTPGPDVVTQLCLALPALVLFELSLLAMKR
ncbi:MAG: twin arginine-targeting protein translocase TatC [Elusimicrobia bacterium RIFCSPHIGHO2_02_FULL_57_9]|nr:MAG: twin arginine-targeting protein translocase TatC [Elusimicrobia bacterium RIFCSPHIGHO2_02_FULL_57_9]